MTYASAHDRDTRERRSLEESLSNKWVGLNFNQSNRNHSTNLSLELAQEIHDWSGTAKNLLKEYQADQEFNARWLKLTSPAKLSLAELDQVSEERRQEFANSINQFAIAAKDDYPYELASQLDTSKNKRTNTIDATKWVNTQQQGSESWIRKQIATSNLVLRDGDRLIDLKDGIHNSRDYALVVSYFSKEYNKSTRLLDLEPEFLRGLKVHENIDKMQASMLATFTSHNNQKQSIAAEQEIRDEIVQTLTANESVDYNYIMKRLSTVLDDKGEYLDPKGQIEWLFDYANNLAKTDYDEGMTLWRDLNRDKKDGGGYEVNGKRVNFSSTRLANLEAEILDNEKKTSDRINKRKLVNENLLSRRAREENLTNDEIQAEAKELGLSGEAVIRIKGEQFAANNLGDPTDEANAMLYEANVNANYPSPDKVVNSENIGLRDSLAEDGRSYYGRENNKTYKDSISYIKAKLSFGGKDLSTTGELTRVEALMINNLAKKKLDNIILENFKELGMDGAIEKGYGIILKELDKIQHPSDLINHPWLTEAQSGYDKTERGTFNRALVFAARNADSIDFSEPIKLEEGGPLADYIMSLPANKRMEIIRYGSGNFNMRAPESIRDLTVNINRRRSNDTVNERTVGKWLWDSLGQPKISGRVNFKNIFTDIDNDEDLISKIRFDGTAPNLIRALDNVRRYPTSGSQLALYEEALKISGLYNWEQINSSFLTGK